MEDKIFLENPSVKIINDDILKTNAIENNSINLIVTSPPYNIICGSGTTLKRG